MGFVVSGPSKRSSPIAQPQSRRKRARVIVLASAATITASSPLLADSKTYVGPSNGDWNTSSYWSLAGIPASGDWAFFQPTGSSAYSLDESYSAASALGTLTLGNGTGSSPVLNQSAGTFDVGEEFVVSGTFAQQGGADVASNDLYVANASGAAATYNLVNGSLTTGDSFVGYAGGSGTFLQSGSLSVSNLGIPYVGNGTGSVGNVTLSGGSMSAEAAAVGFSGGAGTFLQSGGSSNFGSQLVVGSNPGATGMYSLTGGSLAVYEMDVGDTGANGTFSQSGSLSVCNLQFLAAGLGFGSVANGTILLAAGSLSATNTYIGYLGGSGTFAQTGSQTFSSLGTVTVSSTSTIALAGGTLNLKRINSSGNVIVSGGTLNITSAGSLGTGSLISLSISGPGIVDLGSSGLVIQCTSAAAAATTIGELNPNGHTQFYPVSSIQAYIQSAYDGGAFDGPGLTASAARNDLFDLTTVGALDEQDLLNITDSDYNGKKWMGISITTDNAVLVRFTYYGDTDLDGLVGSADVNNLELGYAGFGDGWVYGDFNYDGVVDAQDVNLLELNYANIPLGDVGNLTPAQVRWLLASEKGLTPARIAAFEARVGVPEPAMLGLAGIAAIGLLGRRKHHRSGSLDTSRD